MHLGELISSLLSNLQSLCRSNIILKNASFQQIMGILSIGYEGVEMSNLSLRLCIDNSTATRLITGLEKKDWVGREKSKRDKRAIKVFLKTKGLVIQQDIEKKIESIGEKIKMEIDDEKRESILEHLYTFQWGLRKTFLKK